MHGHGCFCCGCPICSGQSPPIVQIYLANIIDGQCGDCNEVLNGPQAAEYFGQDFVFDEGANTYLGCCYWQIYPTSTCDLGLGGPMFDDGNGNPAYRVRGQLCVVGCVDNGDGTKTCQISYVITMKGYINDTISETYWESDYYLTFPIEDQWLSIDCCAAKQIGLVFHDGGPTCDGDDGSVQTHAFDPCAVNDLAACIPWTPGCGVPFTEALTEALTDGPVSIEEVRAPSMLKKMANFADAYTKWAAAGFPKRTVERIQEIHDNHCAPCPFFKNDECIKCGCPVVRGDNFRNKLLWATEACPLNPPKWEAEA